MPVESSVVASSLHRFRARLPPVKARSLFGAASRRPRLPAGSPQQPLHLTGSHLLTPMVLHPVPRRPHTLPALSGTTPRRAVATFLRNVHRQCTRRRGISLEWSVLASFIRQLRAHLPLVMARDLLGADSHRLRPCRSPAGASHQLPHSILGSHRLPPVALHLVPLRLHILLALSGLTPRHAGFLRGYGLL